MPGECRLGTLWAELDAAHAKPKLPRSFQKQRDWVPQALSGLPAVGKGQALNTFCHGRGWSCQAVRGNQPQKAPQ